MEVIMYCEKCDKEKELRRVELGGGAGIYICKECFHDEMEYRKYMNSKYPNIYKIENWDNLKKYEEE